VAFLAVTCLIGLREIALPEEAPPPPAAPDINVDQAAESFALEFARAYLTYDAAHPETRERALRPYLPDDLDPGAGFVPGQGSQRVVWAQVAQNQEAPGGGRVIVVAVHTDVATRAIYLALPVGRRSGGELQLTAYPAFVGPPAISRDPLPDRAEVDDADVIAVARRVVTNYLAGERANLDADLLSRAEVSIPSTRLRVRAVEEVGWADGPDSGAVLVTVEASDGEGALYTLSYGLGVERRDDRPYVSFVETVPTST
jgi:Conjugative transposon protein TcpC